MQTVFHGKKINSWLYEKKEKEDPKTMSLKKEKPLKILPMLML